MISLNPFLASTLDQIPRLLGQLNRNPGSVSYGSFDRAYWHYRTNDIAGNGYYRDNQILEWLRAALRFTATIQRPDGSFDEWYLHEGSYVGTAFLTAALSQTILTLKTNQIVVPELSLVGETIKRTARWLVRAEESTVMNQVAGAAFALAAAAEVTGNQTFAVAAQKLEQRLLAEQNREGWWREY